MHWGDKTTRLKSENNVPIIIIIWRGREEYAEYYYYIGKKNDWIDSMPKKRPDQLSQGYANALYIISIRLKKPNYAQEERK